MPEGMPVLSDLPPRSVKPRKRTTDKLPIIAVRHDQALLEDGTLITLEELEQRLPKLPPTIFVKRSIADWISYLDTLYSGDTVWQWRASEHERTIVNTDGKEVGSRVSCVINFFGWKHRAFHTALDPITFYGKELEPTDESEIVRLLRWATTLRDWCHENGLPVKPTNGGIGSLLLRDSRFYPAARRKVPGAINERTREHLPGNHYQLLATASPEREYTAIYLDQKRAHHYHARTTPLPDSNSLYAHGRFLNLADGGLFHIRDDFHGLYYLSLFHPSTPPQFAPFTYRGDGIYWIWSNEIQFLKDYGFKIEGAIAGWGSFQRDTGIPQYSAWAERQLDKYDDAQWLKPILLSTYGVLAIKPRAPEFVFKRATGTPHTLLTGRNCLHGILTRSTNGRKIEPGIANVLHRGLIEAATRIESLGLAEYLTNLGHNILSIYADAVIVESDDDNPLPLLPDPWRCKGTLTNLRFINQQSFISSQMTKLPGFGGTNLKKYSAGIHGRAPYRAKYEAGTGRKISNSGRHI